MFGWTKAEIFGLFTGFASPTRIVATCSAYPEAAMELTSQLFGR